MPNPAPFEHGEHALIAGRMVGCSGLKEFVPELDRVAREATAAAHKIAAAQALVTLGERRNVYSASHKA